MRSSSLVIEHIQRLPSSQGVAYIYFDYKEQNGCLSQLAKHL